MLREVLGKVSPLYRMANRFRGIRVHEPELRIGYRFLGSSYGGWTLPDGALNADSIVYSAGVGEDISFDLGVIEAVGCKVHGFDPTPIALEWIGKQATPANYVFHNTGIAEEDGEMEFFTPSEGHSFSREPGEGDAQSVLCPVRRLSSITAELGHDHIDLLKMDIEGFEFAVLDDLLAAGLRPRIINVEFHHGYFGITSEQTRKAVRSLQDCGYRIYWVSDLGREYGFILQTAAQTLAANAQKR